MWSRCGRGVVEVWSRCGRGVVEVWSRCGRGVVEVWSRCGRGVVEVWSRCGRGVIKVCIIWFELPQHLLLNQIKLSQIESNRIFWIKSNNK